MPILHVEIVGRPEGYPRDLAQRIADAVGTALESRPNGTWMRLRYVDESAYAENGGARGGPPIIASIVQADPPTGTALKRQVSALTAALADATDHPEENVHVILEPDARGRIAFGGELIE